MALYLHPLFAMTCVDDPLPDATDIEIEAVLLDTPALRALTELMPVIVPGVDGPSEPSGPAPTADLDYDAPRPAFGRR